MITAKINERQSIHFTYVKDRQVEVFNIFVLEFGIALLSYGIKWWTVHTSSCVLTMLIEDVFETRCEYNNS